MSQHEQMTYDTTLLHAAADDIEQRTRSAIDQHHEHYRRAQAALANVPPRLHALLQAYIEHHHRACLNAYHNDHLPIAQSLHDFASQLEQAEANLTPPTTTPS